MNEIWASKGWRARLLTPVSYLFQAIVQLRAHLFKVGFFKVNQFSVPVIVVGNISVGGTGKTPIVSALVERLQAAGFKPGIVSRGYGAEPAKQPRAVTYNTPVALAGDEPSLLARATGVPICVCVDRSAAVQFLIENDEVNVVVSDDGLQHYAMHRDIEIAVVDGSRKLGNGWLLPAGPLREPPSRLCRVNIIAVQQTQFATDESKRNVINELQLPESKMGDAGHFHLGVNTLINLHDGHQIELSSLDNQQVHAVAGLGNPQRYFSSLRSAGLLVEEHAMPDHHRYTINDVTFNDGLPILVTSKDAVKLRELDVDLSLMFEVTVVAQFDQQLDQSINAMIAGLS